MRLLSICAVFALVLLGCGPDKETQEKLAELTARNTQLEQSTNEQGQKIEEQAKQLEVCAKAEEERTAMDQELTELRGKLTRLDFLEAKANELDKLKKDYADLENQLGPGKEAIKRLDFLSSQIEGVKATIVTDFGEIKIKFFPDLAPLHCFNFITRAESGYYDNTQFHRVIPGFMIQGGDPNSRDMNFNDDGGGTPIVSIPHEFSSKHHGRGILSMARRGNPRFGAGSQFFVMHADYPSLNNQYTVFGEVTEGMDVVDQIVKVPRNRRDHPNEPVWVKTIKVYR